MDCPLMSSLIVNLIHPPLISIPDPTIYQKKKTKSGGFEFEFDPVSDVYKAPSAECRDAGDAIVIVIEDKDSWSFLSTSLCYHNWHCNNTLIKINKNLKSKITL